MNSNLFHKIRRLIFSPGTKLELLARSLYHRFSATRINFLIQDRLARHSYRRWIKGQQSEVLPDANRTLKKPKVTFLVDCKNNLIENLSATLESIRILEGAPAQVLLVSLSEELAKEHTQYFNKTETFFEIINTDQVFPLESIKGEFIIFCQAGDLFSPSLLRRFYLHLSQTPDADLFYYDCEIQDSKRVSPTPVFKPKTPSPALCLSYNMFSRGFIRTTLLKEDLGKIILREGLVLTEYEVCLKLLEKGVIIQHIPAILVSQTALPQMESLEIQQIVLDHLARSGVENPVATPTPQGTRFQWAYGAPTLSIIIPSKNNAKLLIPLVQSLYNNKNDLALNLNIVDNDSEDPDTLAFYRNIESEPHIQILPYKKHFNYSEAINLGVSKSESDLILLMNDDMAPIDADWLLEMIQWAQRDDIGVVGAKLLRANQTLQHAGIIMGLVGFVGHIYLNAPEHYFGLWGSADWYRDILAVTGACQMMRREVFEDAGGYDEGFQLAFGDIDFCLRVHRLGYRNIYTPFARLHHYEGHSRGYVTPVKDVIKGYEEFEPYLIKDDPFFSPNLTYTRIPKCAQSKTSHQERRQEINLRRSFYMKND